MFRRIYDLRVFCLPIVSIDSSLRCMDCVYTLIDFIEFPVENLLITWWKNGE